jgi:hypothetical protein
VYHFIEVGGLIALGFRRQQEAIDLRMFMALLGWIAILVVRRRAANRTHLNAIATAHVIRVAVSAVLLAVAFGTTTVFWGAIDVFRNEDFLGELWNAVLTPFNGSVVPLLLICGGWAGWILAIYTLLLNWLTKRIPESGTAQT